MTSHRIVTVRSDSDSSSVIVAYDAHGPKYATEWDLPMGANKIAVNNTPNAADEGVIRSPIVSTKHSVPLRPSEPSNGPNNFYG